jgi:hypothetical protein
MTFKLAFAIFSLVVAIASLVYVLLVQRRMRKRSQYIKPTTVLSYNEGPLIYEGTQPDPAKIAAMGRAAASAAQAAKARQRSRTAAQGAAGAAQRFSTAADRAKARQQAAKVSTVPQAKPKLHAAPVAAPAPDRWQDEDDSVGLAGLAIATVIIDDLASSPAPDFSMPDPTPDPSSFDGGGGDFGGGGSDGSW